MAELTIIDLWAPWCEPCRRLAPVLEDVVSSVNKNREDAVELQKINVDEDEHAASKYDVRGVPTVLFVKNNEIVARVIGLKPKRTYQDLIEENL